MSSDELSVLPWLQERERAELMDFIRQVLPEGNCSLSASRLEAIATWLEVVASI